MKKNLLLVLYSITSPLISKACITCNKSLQEGIYNSTFYPNLFVMLSAFLVVGAIVVFCSFLATKNYKRKVLLNPDSKELTSVPLTSAAVVLGIGLGGFLDGIVLHQILQWHEMLSNRVTTVNWLGKSINMFWDGIFHFYTLLVTLTGAALMWKLLKRTTINHSGYLFSGGLLLGWGLFNIVEGVIDHHLLKLHNIKEAAEVREPWNFGFLILSALLLIIGFILVRIGTKQNTPPETTIIKTLYN